MSSYEPTPKDAALFARHKAARKTISDTRAPVMEAAQQAIRTGATNQELAQLTGLTPETFRKLAETIGVDNRQKAPTVGREAEAARARVATPRPGARPSAPSRGAPPANLNIDPRVTALTNHRIRQLAGWLKGKKPDWYADATHGIPAEWAQHAAVAAGVENGLIGDADLHG